MSESNTIDEYISIHSKEIQIILNKIRNIIKKNAPDAKEKISWNMPTFYQNENLIHFAVNKKHLGIYPTPSAIINFEHIFKENNYKYSKGAVQFKFDQDIPYDLIEKIVKFRVDEVTNKKNFKNI